MVFTKVKNRGQKKKKVKVDDKMSHSKGAVACSTTSSSARHSSLSTDSLDENLENELKLISFSRPRERHFVTTAELVDLVSAPSEEFHDVYYDSGCEYLLLQRKFWLYCRHWFKLGEEPKTEWRLKAQSAVDDGELKWQELIGEEKIIKFFKNVFAVSKATTILSPKYWFPCQVMSHMVVRFYLGDKNADHRIDVCGWKAEPLGAYAVRSFPKSKSTGPAPAKTKVMLFMLNRKAFNKAFSQEVGPDPALWSHVIMKNKAPEEFQVYASSLHLQRELDLLRAIAVELESNDSDDSESSD